MEEPRPKIAYIIPGPRAHLTLEVRWSANAWWMDGPTLYRLLAQLDSGDVGLQEACAKAGITIRQYNYFANLHPLIEERRNLKEMERSMAAKSALVAGVMKGDKRSVIKYLRMKEPEVYDLRHTGPKKPPGPGRGRGARGKKLFWGY